MKAIRAAHGEQRSWKQELYRGLLLSLVGDSSCHILFYYVCQIKSIDWRCYNSPSRSHGRVREMGALYKNY